MHTQNYPQQDVPCEGITYRNKAVIFLVVIKKTRHFLRIWYRNQA